MYILTPSEIASALQSGDCRNPTDNDIGTMKDLLLHNMARVCSILEVETLRSGVYEDTFTISGAYSPTRLRLSNAFLQDDQNNLFGNTWLQGLDDCVINRRYGTIELPRRFCATRGQRATVTYRSGFEVDSNKFFIGLPQHIKSLAIDCIVHWYRVGMLAPKIVKGLSLYDAATNSLRELRTYSMDAYMRPRANCYLPVNYEQRD